jgi:hypothetical protein
VEDIALWGTILPLDIACQAVLTLIDGLLMQLQIRLVHWARIKVEIIAQRTMAAADGLLRSVSKQTDDAPARPIRTQPATDQQAQVLRLRRFSQCPRRVCFALCDDYCERVFAAWQDCSAYELAQESGRRRSQSSHS